MRMRSRWLPWLQAVAVALLLARGLPGSPAPAVESAMRRMWERPALAMAAGLNNPPPGYQAGLLRALELTTRLARLTAVGWKDAPGPPDARVLRGTLSLTATGRMPPSSAEVRVDLEVTGLGLDRRALEHRGSVRVLETGRLTGRTHLPLGVLEALQPGTRIRQSAAGTLAIGGHRKVLLLDIPFELDGPIEVRDRIHLVLKPTQLALASITAPGPVRDMLVDSVNPVFCIDAAMGALRHLALIEIEFVQVKGGELIVAYSGRLRPPGDPDDPKGPHHPPRRK